MLSNDTEGLMVQSTTHSPVPISYINSKDNGGKLRVVCDSRVSVGLMLRAMAIKKRYISIRPTLDTIKLEMFKITRLRSLKMLLSMWKCLAMELI